MTAFGDAFLVILREGIEALLVIGALGAYLARSGAGVKIKVLWQGAALALVASLATAWVFDTYFGGNHDDLIEGCVMAVAAVLLLYVSGWLYVRQDPAAWQRALRAQVDKAVAKDGSNAFALGSVAFLAVYREGAETVLFLEAQAMSAGGWNLSIAAGIVSGFVVLALIYVLMERVALKLPLRPIFVATSALLFVLAIRFIGAALKEFQEMGWVPYDEVASLSWVEALGLNPSAEALLIQGLVVVVAASGAAFLRYRPAKFQPT